MDTLLVDGYNLLFSEPRFRRALAVSLEEGRDELIAELESWCPLVFDLTIIYFDARRGRRTKTATAGPVRVEYTSSTADAAIERFVYHHADPRSLTVATNDRMIRQIVRGKGATAVTLQELSDVRRQRG